MKIWTKEEIKTKIQVNDKWLYRAIIAIFKLQTHDEQESYHTKHQNGIGFNAYDAEILSDMAKILIAQERAKKTYYLNEKQKKYARERILKYSGQLEKVANKHVEQPTLF